ncbi:MAG: RNA-processing protein [DPANN group archaeon]|nr:RNA-processing protein [DPANN group archaeon]
MVRVPKDRVAVLIGKKGEVKRELEQQARIRITVDSKEGEVTISGKDALRLYSAKEIIKAIARGFNPDIALLLLRQDYLFELIDLTDFVSTKNHLLRIKGRLIGTEGKSRRIIEELTDTNISVYGKTVSIIGNIEKVPIARRSIEMIISGSPHAKVYQFLERMHVKMHRSMH